MKEHVMTVFQIGLGAFYAFLFKLTQEEDLCVLTVSANRYRTELENMIGFFVNTVPHRLNVDSEWTCRALMDHVKELMLVTLPHTHLPYQEIVSRLSTTVLQALFIVETHHENETLLSSDIALCPLGSKTIDCETVAKFDLTCSLLYDISTRSMKVSLDASSDLFDLETVESIACRFHLLLNQLFSFPPSTRICEFSLLLPHEIQLLHHLSNQENINASSNISPIHQKFASQAEEHPQKLAVILDDQSLTYAEVLHSSQSVAHHLQNEHDIKANDIVAQCIDRSIEMVS
jgi:non-ribosomal peptide synthetase component F